MLNCSDLERGVTMTQKKKEQTKTKGIEYLTPQQGAGHSRL
jgi:hypothetical protein